MKTFLTFLIMMTVTVAVHAQQPTGLSDADKTEETLSENTEEEPGTSLKGVSNTVFWSTHVDETQEWGAWLKDYYRPYADKLTAAMLNIVASVKDIHYEGKSSEELLEEIHAAQTKSLRSMELIQPPPELVNYHKKLVELYRYNIDADPNESVKNALATKKLTDEVDEAMTRALRLRGVPQEIIDYINRN